MKLSVAQGAAEPVVEQRSSVGWQELSNDNLSEGGGAAIRMTMQDDDDNVFDDADDGHDDSDDYYNDYDDEEEYDSKLWAPGLAGCYMN